MVVVDAWANAMTPTLSGRWQTRFLLLSTVGLAITALFSWWYGRPEPFINLGLVLFFGLAWDMLYIFLQSYRWDGDWPPFLQLFEGIWEGLFIFGLRYLFIGLHEGEIGLFFFHYFTVWVALFIMTQGPLRVIFPGWRFHGGRWL